MSGNRISAEKVMHVAVRDFLATVSTKGFFIGLLLMPAMVTLVFALTPKLMRQRSRPVEGQVAVIDGTGRLAPELTSALEHGAGDDTVHLQATTRGASFDLDRARQWLLDPSPATGHLAVVTIDADALDRNAAGNYGGYRVYVPLNSDPRVETAIYSAVRGSLVALRARTRGMNASDVEAMLRVERPASITVSRGADRISNPALRAALPFVFVALMFVSVMVGGQGLMTTTIEEKSSRVVEVLLSAVSPLELMTGKLLGQLAVGLVALGVYIGLGLTGLSSFALMGFVDLSLIGYMVAYFLVTYLLMGSIMIAIGAAVNEMREAQQLMMPVTVSLMLPWFLAAPILRNPSSTFATVISFVPPVNTFAMLMRLTSTAPPPAWQAWLTVVVGAVAAVAAIWCAAKVYRIGLLMFGKPPDFATLVRWIRAA